MQLFKICLDEHPLDFELIPLYDIHFGTIFHDKDLFHRTINYIKNNKNAYCFLGGDIIEGIALWDKRYEHSTLDKDFQDNADRIISYSIEYASEKLYPIRDKILFMIGGNHECLVWDTEVLTKQGWKKAIDITYKDDIAQFDINTGSISFNKPIKISKFFVDKWVEVKTNLGEEAITLNHNLVINKKFVKVKDIINKSFKQSEQYYAGYLEDKYRNPLNLSEDWLKLLTWVIMDGTWVIYSNNKMRIQFKLSKKRKIESLTSLLEKMQIPYTIKKATLSKHNKKQPYLIRIYGKYAKEIIYLLNKEKKFPKDWIYKLNYQQVLTIIYTIAETDGQIIGNNIEWTSVNIDNLETIQLACIFNNIPCIIKKVKYTGFSKNRKYIYKAYIYPKTIKGFYANFNVHSENTLVVAIETSKRTLITRRNGKISFTGNSKYFGKFGVDIIAEIARNLELKNFTHNYECFCKIHLKKTGHTYSIDIYAHHGHGAATVRTGTLLNRLEDALTCFNADLVIFGHCLSEDTEILTKDGWKGINEIKEGDEVLTLNTEKNILEYNIVLRKWIYDKETYPELIHIKGRGIDILVTKDHRIIYKGKNGYLETTAGNPKAVMEIPQSGTFPTDGLNMSDEEIKLYAWIISEGTLYNVKNKKEATGLNIYQNKNSKYVEEIKEILDKLNIKYTIKERKFKGRKFTIRGKTYKTKDNSLRFYIWTKDAKKIRKILKEKRIPQIFKDKMNDRQWYIFLKELIKGDGYFYYNEKRFPWLYYTKDKKLADDIQEMCIKHNLRCSIHKRRNNYELIITKHNTYTVLRRNQNTIKTVKNTGKVWCVSVANGTIVTRRNGKIAIVGNSHQLVFTYKNYLTMNNKGTKIICKRKYLIRVGGFRFARSLEKMGVIGYEEKFGMRPNAVGTVIIKPSKIKNHGGIVDYQIITFT